MLISTSQCRLALCMCVFVCMSLRHLVSSRAILVEPPHRSSLWRFNYNTTRNYQYDSLNCGGYDWQWGVNGGRCGICGDIYGGSQDHDDGGKFASGIVIRKYKDGHYVNITFEVSSNYLGYIEFRLCPRNSTLVRLNQSCFDRYPLWIDESHGTRYYIGSRGGIYDIHVRLPGGVVCKKCVLQWTYKTGYRYNGEDTCQCLGCGKQEQYINCADIEVYPSGGWEPPTPRPNVNPGSHGRPRGHGVPVGDVTGNQFRVTMDTKSVGSSSIQSPDVNSLLGMSNVSRVLGTLAEQSSISLRETFTPNKSKDTDVMMTSATGTSLMVTRSTELSPSYTPLHTSSSTIATPIINTGIRIVTSSIPLKATQVGDVMTSRVFTNQKSTTPRKRIHAVSTDRRTTREPIQIVQAFTSPTRKQNKPLQQSTTVENTQFVSVSNILHRFFPEYIPPYMFPPMLLSNPIRSRRNNARRNRIRGIPAGCDVNSDDFRCVARGIYNNSPGISTWCEINCRASNCVSFMCECSCDDLPVTNKSTCHAISEFAGVDGMDQWCTANCKLGYCPPNTCSVEDCRNETQTNGEA